MADEAAILKAYADGIITTERFIEALSELNAPRSSDIAGMRREITELRAENARLRRELEWAQGDLVRNRRTQAAIDRIAADVLDGYFPSDEPSAYAAYLRTEADRRG